jgi:hypothetical protein
MLPAIPRHGFFQIALLVKICDKPRILGIDRQVRLADRWPCVSHASRSSIYLAETYDLLNNRQAGFQYSRTVTALHDGIIVGVPFRINQPMLNE